MVMNIQLALEVLNKDYKMCKITNSYDLPSFKPKDNYFESLMQSIVFQQLSGK